MDRYLIDTDILSYYFKGDPDVVQRFNQYLEQFDMIEISLVTYYEIRSGLLARNAWKQLAVFEDFVAGNIILLLTEKSVNISSELYSILRQAGKTVDDIDLLIAGVAIENEMILVTNNENHFGRIPGLNIDNWKKPPEK